MRHDFPLFYIFVAVPGGKQKKMKISINFVDANQGKEHKIFKKKQCLHQQS